MREHDTCKRVCVLEPPASQWRPRKNEFVCSCSTTTCFYIWTEDRSRPPLWKCVGMGVRIGQEANDKVKRQTEWLRCPQLKPIGSPKIHHSCPLANPRMPCGAGISLEDCYLAKCSQANDAGSGGWCKMWSLKTQFSFLRRVCSFILFFFLKIRDL